MFERFKNYAVLMRLNKPVGILLLMWPTLWAVWIASNGHPTVKMVVIFVFGVIVMRSAGCIINDLADRDLDRYVKRTMLRPITAGKVSIREAITLFTSLIAIACVLLWQLNWLTIYYAFFALLITIIYPFCKRFTYMPQAVLGIAFAFAIPMAFAAIQNHVPMIGWILFCTSFIWPVIYDTMYAMVDRDDDLLIGVKSTAIFLGSADRIIIGLLQIIFLLLLGLIGVYLQLKIGYYYALILVVTLCIYQQKLIFSRAREKCFKAFLNNQWIGLLVFLGLLAGL